MEIGIFARTFAGQTLQEVLDKIVAHRLRRVHFNLKCAGVESLPEIIEDDLCRTVRNEFQKRQLVMVGISGTFNAIHPNKAIRADQTRRAQHLIRRCRALGTSLFTLCTGTRDPNDMWRYHPDNAKVEAWSDLLRTLELLLAVAEEEDVVLGIEPETANVIDSAAKARGLLDQMNSKHLGIIMDAANLFWPDELSEMPAVLEEAFELLGPDIVVAHAKDIAEEKTETQQAAGSGRLDWDTYFRLLKQSGFDGSLVLHNLAESQADDSIAFVRHHAAKWYPPKTDTA